MKKELQELYRSSGGDHFGFTVDEFVQLLDELSRDQLGVDADLSERLEFCRSLHVKDVVFVRACLKGNEEAWTSLVNRYQTKLFVIACQITKEENAARELADSLFADLFGVCHSGREQRPSKLLSYGGRCSLEGWLRALLAQQFVNRLRQERRFVPFDERRDSEEFFTLDTQSQQQSPLLARALDQALDGLSAEERFLLSGYFLDGRTKAELARMLGVHETTVGRQIERALKNVRTRTIRHLCDSGLSLSAAREMLTGDVRALHLDVRNRLLADEA